MNDGYKKLHDIASIAKVACATIGFFYLIAWVLLFLNFPFMGPVDFFFEPFAKLIRVFGIWKVDFMERSVDMTYVLAGVILMMIYPVFSFVAEKIKNIIQKREFEEIRMKERDQHTLNKSLEREYLEEIMAYSRFAVLLELILKPIVDPNLLDSKINLKELREKNYQEIKNSMKVKYPSMDYQITDERIHVILGDFKHFDEFLQDFLSAVNILSANNKKMEIETGFNLTLDAIRADENKKDSLDFMTKISSFNYKNKAIATGAFTTRYELEKKRMFNVVTAGISRFFEKEHDENGQPVYIDFELFSLKKNK